MFDFALQVVGNLCFPFYHEQSQQIYNIYPYENVHGT